MHRDCRIEKIIIKWDLKPLHSAENISVRLIPHDSYLDVVSRRQFHDTKNGSNSNISHVSLSREM